MKAPALLPLAAILALASCYGPGPMPPPGPRGYSLDRAPGDVRYGQDPATPADTRYLDTGDPLLQPAPPINPNDPAAATVQVPGQPVPLTPGAIPPPTVPSTVPPGGAAPPPNPVVATPPSNPPAAPATPPAPTSYPTAIRTKPGFVKSPFDSLGREIDVREMRSGQKARCPYTQKVFLVP